MMKRRSFFLILSALVAAGLFAGGTAETTECAAGERTIEHFAGTTCIPAEPQRIVTTHDQNALLPLLELGIQPIGSAALVLDDGTSRFRRVDEYDTSDIAFVGAYGAPSLEAIAALGPDLIVVQQFDIEIYEELSRIAPTVLVRIFDRPLTEALLQFGEVTGTTPQARASATAYDERIDELRAALTDSFDEITVSVIVPGNNPGEFYNGALGQAIGTVMEDVGLNRPAPERSADDTRVYWTVETLSEHDADAMLVIDFSGDGDADPVLEAFVTSPLFTSLAVSQAGQVHIIDGSATVGTAWGKMDSFLDELEGIVLDPDFDTAVVD